MDALEGTVHESTATMAAKAALIERLAAERYDYAPHFEGSPPAFAALDEADKEIFRNEARWCVPVVVAFVAEWLETEPEDGHRPALTYLAADWRREMA